MTERWYIETYTLTGRISPAVFHGQRPETEGRGDNIRLKSASGYGARIRPGSLKQINEGHYRLNLKQLAEVYGPDGRFNYS